MEEEGEVEAADITLAEEVTASVDDQAVSVITTQVASVVSVEATVPSDTTTPSVQVSAAVSAAATAARSATTTVLVPVSAIPPAVPSPSPELSSYHSPEAPSSPMARSATTGILLA